MWYGNGNISESNSRRIVTKRKKNIVKELFFFEFNDFEKTIGRKCVLPCCKPRAEKYRTEKYFKF